MTELPSGWVGSTLAEVADWSSGGTPRSGTPEYYGGDVLWAVIGDLNDGRVFSTASTITVAGLDNSSAKVVEAGTVLVAMYGSIGKLGIAQVPMATNQAIACAAPSSAITREWLFWWLRSQRKHLLAAGKGGTQSNISQTVLKPWPIPLAPCAEQERIVAAIEEAFSKLDAGEAGLRTVRQLLKRMRDAILAAAVTGRLLPQDPTDTPATKLLADLGVEPVIDEHVPAAWASARLAELANLVTDGDHRPPKRVPSGIPHLTAKNVRGGRFDLTGCSFVDDAGFAQTRSRYEPIAGDVIVTCVGTIGRVAVVPEGLTFSADRNLAAVRLRPVVEPQFAKLVLGSPAIQNWMAEASGSTAQPHLYLRDLRSIVVPVAPVEEQQRIVAEVDRQMSFLNACERTIDAGLERSAALRRTVLKAAFEGRLVEQDPTDEPASALLERIGAERAAAPRTVRRSRRTA